MYVHLCQKTAANDRNSKDFNGLRKKSYSLSSLLPLPLSFSPIFHSLHPLSIVSTSCMWNHQVPYDMHVIPITAVYSKLPLFPSPFLLTPYSPSPSTLSLDHRIPNHSLILSLSPHLNIQLLQTFLSVILLSGKVNNLWFICQPLS